MKKSIIIFCILLVALYAQPTEEEIKAQQAQQSEASMKRTACLVLSRYHSNTQKDAIEGVINELPNDMQQKYISKMYAVAIQSCLPIITIDEAQKFFVEDPEFNPSDMFYIFEDFDYTAVASDPETLTKNQQNLIKFIKNFDEEMQVRREEREAEEDQTSEQSRFQMKFFGFSFSDLSSNVKVLYVLIFVGIFGGAILYGFKKLDDTKKGKSPNKRRSPKKRQ